MTKPVGEEVGLYLDLRELAATGDVIETRTGRQYLVADVRVQERGKHAGRQHIRAVVLGKDAAVGSNTRVHRIRWYRRERGAGVNPRGRR